MARGNYKGKIKSCIFVFVTLSSVLNDGVVNGRTTAELVKHKGTIKTIKNEDGDVFDCVDIYKQPAFDHPLLKNHTIQMKPSSYPKETKEESFKNKAFEGWLRSVNCPGGTIPIIRMAKYENHQAMSFTSSKKQVGAKSIEFAQAGLLNGDYHGARAYINVWNPKTANGDYSAAQIWLVSGKEAVEKNVIQGGWMTGAPDRETRLVIGWTKDGYRHTGCYNHNCPGFVQTNWKYALGAIIRPLSTYGGKQYEIRIGIQKDKTTGHWWFQILDQTLGYWPASIFTSLANGSNNIYWGGEVGTDTQLLKTTEMGSGHFPREGFGKASFFHNLRFVDKYGFTEDPKNLTLHVLNPSLYDILVPFPIKRYGTHLYFGGPGHR